MQVWQFLGIVRPSHSECEMSPSGKCFRLKRTGSGGRGQSTVSLDAIKHDRTLGSLHITLSYSDCVLNIFLWILSFISNQLHQLCSHIGLSAFLIMSNSEGKNSRLWCTCAWRCKGGKWVSRATHFRHAKEYQPAVDFDEFVALGSWSPQQDISTTRSAKRWRIMQVKDKSTSEVCFHI